MGCLFLRRSNLDGKCLGTCCEVKIKGLGEGASQNVLLLGAYVSGKVGKLEAERNALFKPIHPSCLCDGKVERKAQSTMEFYGLAPLD